MHLVQDERGILSRVFNLSGFIVTVGADDEEDKTVTGVTENAILRSTSGVEID